MFRFKGSQCVVAMLAFQQRDCLEAAATTNREVPMNARFSIANNPVARIEALPVNAAHRASARADYLAAERSVERIFTLLANIRALVVACRSAFGLRERSACGRRPNTLRPERRKFAFPRGRCRG